MNSRLFETARSNAPSVAVFRLYAELNNKNNNLKTKLNFKLKQLDRLTILHQLNIKFLQGGSIVPVRPPLTLHGRPSNARR